MCHSGGALHELRREAEQYVVFGAPLCCLYLGSAGLATPQFMQRAA